MTAVKNLHKPGQPESPGLCCCKKGERKQSWMRETADGKNCRLVFAWRTDVCCGCCSAASKPWNFRKVQCNG